MTKLASIANLMSPIRPVKSVANVMKVSTVTLDDVRFSWLPVLDHQYHRCCCQLLQHFVQYTSLFATSLEIDEHIQSQFTATFAREHTVEETPGDAVSQADQVDTEATWEQLLVSDRRRDGPAAARRHASQAAGGLCSCSTTWRHSYLAASSSHYLFY